MKKTLKEIRETVRNEIMKQCNEKMELCKKHASSLEKSNEELRQKNIKLARENDELKEKLHIYEDWIERLQEFCNMPDDEREKAVKEYRVNVQLNEKMDSLMSMYSRFFNI